MTSTFWGAEAPNPPRWRSADPPEKRWHRFAAQHLSLVEDTRTVTLRTIDRVACIRVECPSKLESAKILRDARLEAERLLVSAISALDESAASSELALTELERNNTSAEKARLEALSKMGMAGEIRQGFERRFAKGRSKRQSAARVRVSSDQVDEITVIDLRSSGDETAEATSRH